jgi:hypothetical protein
MTPISAWADSACPAQRPYALQRQDEDYSYLRDAACRRDYFDPIKFIPLSAQKDQYLTLGGEVREWYEGFQNANWRVRSTGQKWLPASADFRVRKLALGRRNPSVRPTLQRD